jgi:hypothetical protein
MMRALPLLVLIACTPPKPPAPVDVTNCPRATAAVAEDVCDGLYTRDAGLACVRCPDQAGCVDTARQVYCTAGPCASDPLCAASGIAR